MSDQIAREFHAWHSTAGVSHSDLCAVLCHDAYRSGWELHEHRTNQARENAREEDGTDGQA